MADAAIVSRAVASAPKDYTLASNEELYLKAVRALFDGASAGSAFLPALQLVAPDGTVMWTGVPATEVAAGASADVSWFPGVDDDAEAGATPSPSGITAIGSRGGTIAVTAPNGPTANLDLPASGVVAGTYGDGSHVPQVTVNTDGIVTGVTLAGVSGGSGTIGFEVGYDQITAPVTVSSTTEATGTTVIAGSAHTFDGSPVLCEFSAPQGAIGANGGFMILSLFEGATQIGRLTALQLPGTQTSSLLTPLHGNLRFTPTAGSHTYKVTGFISVGATCIVQAGAGGIGAYVPAYLRFTKV